LVSTSEEEVTVAINPDEIENKQFTIGLRGFDRDEVEDYLGSVARQIRRLDAQLSEAEAAASAIPVTEDVAAEIADPIPARLARQANATLEEDLTYFTDDRFTEFGDRMASLLRLAHEDAGEVRSIADQDAIAAREASDSETLASQEAAAETKNEAEAYRGEVRAEAEAYREEVKAEAEAYREEAKAEAQAERETAAKALEDARGESADLLAQARSQADLIKYEADEMSRAKIRENVETAEKRLSILRTTEVSSRERIAVAQNELQAALARLEENPLQELDDPSVADGILEAAKEKAAAAGPAIAAAPEADATPDEVIEVDEHDAQEVVEADVIEAAEVVQAEADEIIEVDADEVDAKEDDAEEVIEVDAEEAEADEVVEAEEIVEAGEAEEVAEPAAETEEVSQTEEVEEIEAAEDSDVDSMIEPADQSIADPEVPEVVEQPADLVSELRPATEATDSGSKNTPWWAKKRKNEGAIPPPPPPPSGAVSVVDSVPSAPASPGEAPLSGVAEAARAAAEEMNAPEVAIPDSEDALARLVREAMQKAVEGARGTDG
jgi:DivIVA domain-containing protein